MGQIIVDYIPGTNQVSLTGASAALTFDGKKAVTYPQVLRSRLTLEGSAGAVALKFADNDGNSWAQTATIPKVGTVIVEPAPTGITNSTTGAGTASLGTNCPAATPSAPYTWLQMTASDGTIVVVPAWK